MTLEEQFNQDLHGGGIDNGMLRCNGYYLNHNPDESQTVLFDNGNEYHISPSGEVVHRIDGEDEIFIDRQIIRKLDNWIKCNPLLNTNYNYSIINDDDYLEIVRHSKRENKDLATLVRMVINRDNRSIEVSNIMIPFEVKHHGLGKKILLEIFKIAKKNNYQLYLVQMVEGFYERMIARGAKMIVPFDMVEITENTNLE